MSCFMCVIFDSNDFHGKSMVIAANIGLMAELQQNVHFSYFDPYNSSPSVRVKKKNVAGPEGVILTKCQMHPKTIFKD